MPRDLLLPLQLSVAVTLCKKLRELGLQMWLFLDELGKYAMSPEAAMFFKRLAAEVRHGLISLCAGGQTMADLPPESWAGPLGDCCAPTTDKIVPPVGAIPAPPLCAARDRPAHRA
jgi:hypothetical protein